MENRYYHTEESVNEYINLAKDVNGKELIDEFDAFLDDGMSLLEIGSGPGSDYELLSEKYSVVGSDNSKEFIRHLKSKYGEDHFWELDAVSLDTSQKFDGIYSNKVLHHLTDDELVASISRQYDILQDDGVVCHSFWKGEGDEEFKGMYVNYHTMDELKVLFSTHFDTLLLKEYAEFEDGDSVLFIGKKR